MEMTSLTMNNSQIKASIGANSNSFFLFTFILLMSEFSFGQQAKQTFKWPENKAIAISLTFAQLSLE